MGLNTEHEGLNLPKSTMRQFFNDVEGKLSLLTGLVNYEDFGLTLQQVRRPMLVIGKPGVGKTCGIISAINSLNEKLPAEKRLGFKKILLGQTVVGTLTGIPVVKPDGSVVRVQIPDLPDPNRDGEYGVLFLDEITTADEMQIQPALGLADDSRSLGEYTLPEHWIVIAAGNGPDCTNFIRLDDMTISRFVAYDISYNYKTDFRPYAHETGVHEDIIAFLNFSKDCCVRVESTETDSAGKMFPCPRTWERLSIELKMREAMGRPVSVEDMPNFAGRIVGIKAGREFGAFLAFKVSLGYDIEKIMRGEEREPEIGMAEESFHIVAQGVIKSIIELLKSTGDGQNNYPLSTYQACANGTTWMMQIHELDRKLDFVAEIRTSCPGFFELTFDKDFIDLCPAFDDFLSENLQLIASKINDIKNLGL